MPTSKIVSFLPLAIIVLATLMVGLGAGYLIGTGDTSQNPRNINSFEDCAAAGYPIMESYPEQCAVPGGRSFTRQIPPVTSSPIDPGDGGMVACTMEAKICPDGSAVGRSGPKCEFAPCPGE